MLTNNTNVQKSWVNDTFILLMQHLKDCTDRFISTTMEDLQDVNVKASWKQYLQYDIIHANTHTHSYSISIRTHKARRIQRKRSRRIFRKQNILLCVWNEWERTHKNLCFIFTSIMCTHVTWRHCGEERKQLLTSLSNNHKPGTMRYNEISLLIFKSKPFDWSFKWHLKLKWHQQIPKIKSDKIGKKKFNDVVLPSN